MKSLFNSKLKNTDKIFEVIGKIPGGSMLVPMFIAAIIKMFIPQLFLLGGPFTAAFSGKGTMTIIGIMIVLIGMQTNFKQLLFTFKRGGILVILKLIINIIFGILVMRIFGMKGIFGISTLALVVCITSCNPGVYIALMEQYGDETDVANFALLNIVGLPFIPMVILGFASGYGLDYKSIMAAIIPMLIGMILGAINPKSIEVSKYGIKLLIPFLGFCLGSNIDIISAFSSAGQGIILFLIFSLINNVPLLFFDRIILHQKGHASTAICCVAGLAIAIPKLMLDVDSAYQSYVQSAMAQIAFVVIISTFTTAWRVKQISNTKNYS